MEVFNSGKFSYPYFFLKISSFYWNVGRCGLSDVLIFFSFFSTTFYFYFTFMKSYSHLFFSSYVKILLFLKSYFQEIIFLILWIVHLIRSCSCFMNTIFFRISFNKLTILPWYFPHKLYDIIVCSFCLPIVLNLASFIFEVSPLKYLIILLFKYGLS